MLATCLPPAFTGPIFCYLYMTDFKLLPLYKSYASSIVALESALRDVTKGAATSPMLKTNSQRQPPETAVLLAPHFPNVHSRASVVAGG